MDDPTFLQAICADPDADGPRLRYADYLDEKGDAARAEFIRVQCALAAAEPSDPVVGELGGRERALLEAHWREWLKPACQALAEPTPVKTGLTAADRYALHWATDTERRSAVHWVAQTPSAKSPYLHSGQFRRGFLSHVALVSKPHKVVSHVARLFERCPIDGLTFLGHATPEIRKTLAAVDAGRLRSLELVGGRPDAVRMVLGHRALTGLRELAVWVEDGLDLGTAEPLPSLRSLIVHASATSADGMDQLGRGPYGRQLERLEIVGEGPTTATAEALAGSFPSDHRLTYLGLGQFYLLPRTINRLQARFGAACHFDPPPREWPVRYHP